MDDRVSANGVGGGLDILGDSIAENVERQVASLVDVDAGELGEVIRQGEVGVLGL